MAPVTVRVSTARDDSANALKLHENICWTLTNVATSGEAALDQCSTFQVETDFRTVGMHGNVYKVVSTGDGYGCSATGLGWGEVSVAFEPLTVT